MFIMTIILNHPEKIKENTKCCGVMPVRLTATHTGHINLQLWTHRGAIFSFDTSQFPDKFCLLRWHPAEASPREARVPIYSWREQHDRNLKEIFSRNFLRPLGSTSCSEIIYVGKEGEQQQGKESVPGVSCDKCCRLINLNNSNYISVTSYKNN